MISNIPKILIFFYLVFNSSLQAQEIWRESFTVPNKGIWGGENGTIQTDFSGITTGLWNMPMLNCRMPEIMQKRFLLREDDLKWLILQAK